jgi:hypothetical protein
VAQASKPPPSALRIPPIPTSIHSDLNLDLIRANESAAPFGCLALPNRISQLRTGADAVAVAAKCFRRNHGWAVRTGRFLTSRCFEASIQAGTRILLGYVHQPNLR